MRKIVCAILVILVVFGSFSTALAAGVPGDARTAGGFMKEAKEQAGLLADTISAGDAAAKLLETSEGSSEIAVFVSTDGNDISNIGSIDAPFVSVERARSVVRELLKTAAKPITVYVREGKYFFEQPVVFEAADSGTAAAPVTYRSYDGEKVVLSGAKTLQTSENKLAWSEYKGNIYVADVPAGLDVDQLYIDGKKQIMGRYPNYDASQTLQGSTSQANIKTRSAGWADPAGAYIRAIHQNAWGGNSFIVTGKDSNNPLGLKYTWIGDNNRGAGINNNILVENLLEEVDSPLEWYYDNKQGKLYVYPESGVDLAAATIEGAVTEEILKFTGEKGGKAVTDITIDGFEISKTKRTMFTGDYIPLMRGDWCVVRAGALFLQDAENLTIQNCTIQEIGGNGIFISGHNSGHTIDNNEILHLGSTGILLAGLPESVREPSFWEVNLRDGKPMPESDPYYVHKTSIDDTTPGPKAEHYPKDITISKNHIMDVGIFEKQSCGVSLSVAHNIKVLQNTIHESPRAGINVNDGTFGGHEIAFNDVFDCQRETADHGQFNSWGRDRFWSLNGFDTGGNRGDIKYPNALLDVIDPIVIHDNRWYHDGKTHTWGIDLDDGSSNYEIYNNLCLNMGIKLREGFNRKVHNNIIVNGEFNIHCTFKDAHDEVYGNIVLQNAPYQFAGSNDLANSKNAVDKNWVYDFGQKINWPGNWESLGFDQNAVTDNPMFTDPRKNDYTVNNTDVMEEIGFENFSMDQFGKPGCAYKSPVFAKLSPGGGSSNMVMREDWLGATITAVHNEAIQSATGTRDFNGVYFEEVPEGSAAAQYGFKMNDIIKSVNGNVLGYKDTFMPLYDQIPLGGAVSMEIYRDQLPMTINYIKAETTTYYNDTAPEISYGGAWVYTGKVDHTKDSYDKDLKYSQNGPAGTTYFEMDFTGSQIKYMTRTENNMGNVKVTLTDSGGKAVDEKTVDCTSAARTPQAVVYASPILPDGDYKIKAEKVSGEYFILDALIVNSSDESVEKITSGPITVKRDDSLIYELEDGQELDISVPVTNHSAKPFAGEIATVLYDVSASKETLTVARESFSLNPGESKRFATNTTIPEGAATKRLAILLYEAETMRPIALPYTVDGGNVSIFKPSMRLGTDEIETFYEKDSRVLYAGLKGLHSHAQAMLTARGMGDVTVFDQATIDANGQAVFSMKVPEGFAGDVSLDIRDEFGTVTTKTLTLDSSVSQTNKTYLHALLEGQAKDVLSNKDTYTFETWLAFETAYRHALAVNGSTGATQDMIETAANGLSDAIAKLRAPGAAAQKISGSDTEWIKIFRPDGSPDGGNTDGAGTGDKWQRREAQVDTKYKGAYAELTGNFTSIKMFGAEKSDSANFIVSIFDSEGILEGSTEVTNSKSKPSGSQLLYAKNELDGQTRTIRFTHNGTNISHYMEIRNFEFTLTPPAHPEVESIVMYSLPYAVEYQVGTDLDVLGAAIGVTYADGTTAQLPVSPDMVSGFDKEQTGKQTLTVRYAEKQTTFDVTVANYAEETLAAANEAIAKLAGYQNVGTITEENKAEVAALIADAEQAVDAYLQTGGASMDALTDHAFIAGAKKALEAFDAKMALRSAYDMAVALDVSMYTLNSKNAFADTIKAAEALLENANAEVQAFDEMRTALTEAQSNLEPRADEAFLSMLGMVVQMYGQFEETGYTAESWSPFKAAMDRAAVLLANPENASVTAVDAAQKALITAGNGLTPVSVNTSVLLNLIVTAQKALEQEELYIPKAVAALRAEIQNANDLLANTPPALLTQDMVEAQSQTLLDALTALWEKGDKTQLKALVDTVGTLNEALFTEGTWTIFKTALTAAQEVLADENALDEDIQKAFTGLQEAFKQLKARANKVGLATAINLANAIVVNIAQYAPASVLGLQEALVAAMAVYENTEATQADVDAAKNALMQKVGEARLKANKTGLRAAVRAAGNVNVSLYTAASVNVLQSVVESAASIISDENVTQQRVDELSAEIYAAISQLERVQAPEPPVTPQPPVTPENGGTTPPAGNRPNTGTGGTTPPAGGNQPNTGTTPNLNGELITPARIDTEEAPQSADAGNQPADGAEEEPQVADAGVNGEQIGDTQSPLAAGTDQSKSADSNAWLFILLIAAVGAGTAFAVYRICKLRKAKGTR